ncbi:MAG TPA: DUF2231 domain-containing protein [Nitrospira sp.]|jgi:uncharacterized membrane protein|nr:DUF2231 domain-containing protein [Nitrospira sp.]
METRATVAEHPIHPMLIPFPIALWIFSLASDLIFLFGFGGPVWKDVALYTMLGGIIGGAAAAIPGYMDYRSLTDPVIVRVAQMHMVINVGLVLLFSINAGLRMVSGSDALLPVFLSLLGVAALGVSGWLGGELVYVQGVAVQPQPEAPAPKRRAA